MRQSCRPKAKLPITMHDLFISHASEDKDELVRPLAMALVDRGLSIWYDEFTLKLGDSLSESIDHGLAGSRYGLVVLSKDFFAKKWPQRELRGLVSKEIATGKAILPIWHKVSFSEVAEFSPSLADLLAVPTSIGLSKLVDKICDAIGVAGKPDAALRRAEQLCDSGHYQAAVLVGAAHLEEHLRAIAIKSLGYRYFKSRPIKTYGLGPLVRVLADKGLVRSQIALPLEDLLEVVRLRNAAAHSVFQPTENEARLVLRHVTIATQ